MKQLERQKVNFTIATRVMNDRGTAFTADRFEIFCNENKIGTDKSSESYITYSQSLHVQNYNLNKTHTSADFMKKVYST